MSEINLVFFSFVVIFFKDLQGLPGSTLRSFQFVKYGILDHFLSIPENQKGEEEEPEQQKESKNSEFIYNEPQKNFGKIPDFQTEWIKQR